jgi:hypothetical protein
MSKLVKWAGGATLTGSTCIIGRPTDDLHQGLNGVGNVAHLCLELLYVTHD